MDIFIFLGSLSILGACTGVLAGLLGIGGGLIFVPALAYILPFARFTSQNTMQVALATSLASIILISGSSAFNHFKVNNIDFIATKWLLPGLLTGGFIGANITEFIPIVYLPKVFGVIVFFLALQMFLSIKQFNKKKCHITQL